MENQVNKSVLNGFQKFFRCFHGFLSVKQRNYKIYQLEAGRITNRILEIKDRHPELSKYLSKVPDFRINANDSRSKLAEIRKYNLNLLELLDKYELELNKESWFI